MRRKVSTIRTDLDWVLAKLSGVQDLPHNQGIGIRRRILMSVSRVAEVDENSGCLRKVTDAEKVIQKISMCITGAEAVPFLDSLLLTAQSSQRVLKILLSQLPVFVKLMKENALDRELIMRVLAIPGICDAETLSAGIGVLEFSSAIESLIEDTIDPVIRKQAVDVSGALDALLVLATPKAPLTKDQLIEGLKASCLCLKCDSIDHNECEVSPTVCLNCRGERAACMRGCTKPCRVCGVAHAGRSIIACLEETVHGRKRKRSDEDAEEPEEKRKMRSTRDYKEAKRRQKEEKKSTSSGGTAPSSSSPHGPFEKLLKDTVAKCCFEHIGDRPEDKDAEIPEWRRVYRSIASVLLEKESRLPEDVRYRCSTEDERASVIKRVRQYCDKHFNKHGTTS